VVMVLVPNSQSFSVPSGVMNSRAWKFKRAMDSVLIDGRDIILDLEPQKIACTGGCRYNPTYDKYMGPNNVICQACRGTGFSYTNRQTIYKCNRRWTNEPFDNSLRNAGQKTPGGLVLGNFVRVKTVIQSYDHIMSSIGATLDGFKIKLVREPRPTGWGDARFYLISWWERANKKISDG